MAAITTKGALVWLREPSTRSDVWARIKEEGRKLPSTVSRYNRDTVEACLPPITRGWPRPRNLTNRLYPILLLRSHRVIPIQRLERHQITPISKVDFVSEANAPRDDVTGVVDIETDVLGEMRRRAVAMPGVGAASNDLERREALASVLGLTRHRAQLTQKYVADVMGTTQSAVSELERGRGEPQLSTLQRYARAVNSRLDIAVVDPAWPTIDETSAQWLWRTVERRTLSPVLTTVAAGASPPENRSLSALVERAEFPPEIVSPILDSLETRGWLVREIDEAGRQSYALGQEAANSIGISLARDKIFGVIEDLNSKVLHSRTVDLPDTRIATVMEATVHIARQLYALRGGLPIVGIGVTVAGIVTSKFGEIKYAPDLENESDKWRGVDFENELQARLRHEFNDEGLRVVVANDANALAAFEYLRTGEEYIGVILLSGAGIGAGFIDHGNVMYGAFNSAGEGGHTIVRNDGPPCRAGFRHSGCLETIASAQGILQTLGIDIGRGTAVDVSAGLLEVNNRSAEPGVEAVLKYAGETLGAFLGSVMTVYDPTRLFVYAQREFSDRRFRSAEIFQKSVDSALLLSSYSKESRVEGIIEPEWCEFNESTNAVAAASSVVRHFLYDPAKWFPAVLMPRWARDEGSEMVASAT